MSTPLFQWSYLGNVRYTTTYWLPEMDRPSTGGEVRRAALPTLDGGVRVLAQGRAGLADQRSPGEFKLEWSTVDPNFLRVAEEDFAKGRTVEVRLDHRWRQLEVTSSGTNDLTVRIAAGYLRTGGETYWLDADVADDDGGYAELEVGELDTVVYVTAADGILTAGSAAELPEGATQLAEITVADSTVTVTTDPSGVANARNCVIMALEDTDPRGAAAGRALTKLVLTLREI